MQRRSDPLANPEFLIQRVYSYAASRLGTGPDAEDATNDTVERTPWRSHSIGRLESFRGLMGANAQMQETHRERV